MRVLGPRASTTKELESQTLGRPTKGPWALVIFISGWFLWGYFHLRPAASVISASRPGAAYGPLAWGHLAYSDVVSLYYAFHLANHAVPYVGTRVEYPVLIGIFMWLAAWAPGVQGYFLASSLGLLACALGTLYFLWRIDRRCAWSFALCPLLLVYGLLNWDVLAIFFMVAGWAQFRERRYASAGVLLSLGVWAKFFPFILLFYGAASLLLRERRDRVHAVKMTMWAGAVALLVNLPFAVANVGNWDHFFVFNVRRGGGDGIHYVLHLSSALSIPTVDLLSGVLVLLVVALLMPRILRGDARAAAAAAAVTFGVFLLVNKVYSPQYMLWLFVFAVLAEWPAWTLVLMSMAGLVDYADAMTALYLSHTRSPAWSWFFHTLYPWNAALRYSSISLALVGRLSKYRRSAVESGERPRWPERPDRFLSLVGQDELTRPSAELATEPDGARGVDRSFVP